MPRRSAARPKCSCSASTTKYFICRRSIISFPYRNRQNLILDLSLQNIYRQEDSLETSLRAVVEAVVDAADRCRGDVDRSTVGASRGRTHRRATADDGPHLALP